MREISEKILPEQVDWQRIIKTYSPLNVRYPEGELIYPVGAYAAGAYLIASGLVSDQSRPQTKRRRHPPLEILGPGNLIGLEILLRDSGGLHLSCARAVSETELFFFEREMFLNMLREEDEVKCHCLQRLAQRLYSLKERTSSLSYASVREQMCRLLLELAENYGEMNEGGISLLPSEITQATLAQLLGVSNATVMRVAASLPEVSISGRIALSPEALRLWLADLERTG